MAKVWRFRARPYEDPRAEHAGYTAEMVARVIEETATRHTIEDGWAGRDGQTVGEGLARLTNEGACGTPHEEHLGRWPDDVSTAAGAGDGGR